MTRIIIQRIIEILVPSQFKGKTVTDLAAVMLECGHIVDTHGCFAGKGIYLHCTECEDELYEKRK